MKKLLLVSVFALFALININSVQAVAGASSITSDLRYGMTNNVQVRALQQILINEGFMTGVPTGNFFNMTIQAVKKFQAAHSVEATGFVGAATRNILEDGGSGGGGGGNSGGQPSSTNVVALTANDSGGPITVSSGSAVRLKWTSVNMQNCVGNEFNTSLATSNQIGVIVNPTINKTYTITCVPVSGTGVTSSVVVNVGAADTPPPTPPTDISTAFAAGDNIKTTDIVNVRSSAGITSYDNSAGKQPLGAKGKIQNVDLNGSKSGGFYWWNVNFGSGVSGWVAEAYITKDTAAPDATVATVSIIPTTNSVAIGATKQLTAVAEDASGNTISHRVFTWTSGTPAVATINSALGIVTGVTAGTATITAASGGKSGTATMTVTTAQTNSCPASYTGPQVTNCTSSDFTSSMTATCTNGVWATTTPCRVPEANLYVEVGGGVSVDNTNKGYSSVIGPGAVSGLYFVGKYATSCLLDGRTTHSEITTAPYGYQPINRGPGSIIIHPASLAHLPRTFDYTCVGPGGTSSSKVTYTDVADDRVTCDINSWSATPDSNSYGSNWKVTYSLTPSCTNATIKGASAMYLNDAQSIELPSGTISIGKVDDVDRTLVLSISQGSHGIVKTDTKVLPHLSNNGRTAVPAGSTSTTGSEKLLFQALGRDALYKIVHNSTSNSLLLKKIQSGKETWSQSYVSNAGNLAKMCLKMVDDNDPHRLVNPPNLSIIPYLTNIFAPIFINSCTSVAAGVYGTLEIVGSGSGSSSSSSGGGSGSGSSNNDNTDTLYQN